MKHWFTKSLISFAFAAPCLAQGDLYETSVKQILKTNCVACHSPTNQTSGLSVATREAMLQGGNRGPAFDAKNPGASLLLSAIRQTGDLKMPPGAKLKDEQIAAIEEWLKTGAPMPTTVVPVKKPGADHWAFQAPKKLTPPRKTTNPIDAFILDRLATAKLKPSPQADRATLIRRVSLDITGLPPTSAELADFVTIIVRTPMSASSIACSPRLTTANAGAATGSISRAMPTATAIPSTLPGNVDVPRLGHRRVQSRHALRSAS